MRQSTLRNVYLFCAIICVTSVIADDLVQPPGDAPPPAKSQEVAGKPSLLVGLHAEWATLLSDQHGYQLRLITNAEKALVEQIITQYRVIRDGESAVDIDRATIVTTAYRSMPSDVRAARFFRVLHVTETFIELQDDEVRARLPMSSIGVLLVGARGGLAVRDRTSRGGDFSRGDRPFGDRGGSSPERTGGPISRGSSGSSVLGAVGGSGSLVGEATIGLPRETGTEAKSKDDDKPKEVPDELRLFYLKHADASTVVDVIYQVYKDAKLRIAIDERLNRVILNGNPESIAKIGSLIEALDTE
ncbi:MAG: secretin N-terminal domain-containing protein [Pirellulaceae bacterium]